MIAAIAACSCSVDDSDDEIDLAHVSRDDKLVFFPSPLSVADACRHVRNAAIELQQAQENGKSHRDVDPDNLIPGLEGKTPGALSFTAPEQILDVGSTDARSDVYALGCMLYFLLAGRPPFRADNSAELRRKHREENAVPLHLVNPEVPVELAVLVSWMIAKDPVRRIQSPLDVMRALTPYLKPASGNAMGPDRLAVKASPKASPARWPFLAFGFR